MTVVHLIFSNDEKMVLPFNEITEEGSIQWKSEAGAVEDGEVISIPLD
ncbi:hypothetical protein ACW2QC_17095 [Virgibacillus sp. FSP13]